MTTKLNLLFTILLLTLTLSHSRPTRPESSSSSSSSSTGSYSDQLKENSEGNNYKNDMDYGPYGPGIIFWPPASDIPIPGEGGDGGRYHYTGPTGGNSIEGIVRTTMVCKEKGHCYNKKLRCPAKCFKSFSVSGKGYGGGGGGGGCIMDCKKKCVAYC